MHPFETDLREEERRLGERYGGVPRAVRGYPSKEADQRVGSTVSLVRDGDIAAVIDPGLVQSRSAILDSLSGWGSDPTT